MYLEKITSPADIKNMDEKTLEELAEEIRAGILKRDSLIGGHVGPNLGFVEATIALHYVFDAPQDKIVFDVSHQCYAHKMLTGRQNGFFNPADYAKISGYTNPAESVYDHFVIGHTSTSLSLASGMAKARDLQGLKHNVIAVIGDGSLSGGEALEGLDFAGSELKSNFIVVVNDNDMSIAENHGGLYQNLRLLRETNGKAELNLFKALGYDYVYVKDGNSLSALIKAFREVKDSKKPVVVHLNTLKGKGYTLAETHKEPWHWSVPFDLNSGEKKLVASEGENYNELTYNLLLERIKKGENIAVLTAGTPGVFGLTPEKRAELGAHYVDVGIAEEHATAMSSGLAKAGAAPVFMVHSSFMQRTYDQLSQDLALNKNPAVILVFWSGLSGADATHLGCFDMAMAANIPNLEFFVPATKEEYLSILNGALDERKGPVVIRVPNEFVASKAELKTSLEAMKRFEVRRKGKDALLIGLGGFVALAERAADELARRGVKATVVTARSASSLDEAFLDEMKATHKVAATFEDGVVDGGFGEKVARFYGPTAVKTLVYGGKKEFSDREDLGEIYQRCRLVPEMIADDVIAALA